MTARASVRTPVPRWTITPRDGIHIALSAPLDRYIPIAADTSVTTGGGTQRISNWTSLPSYVDVAGIQLVYNSALNTPIGSNNGQYVGHSRVRFDVYTNNNALPFSNIHQGPIYIGHVFGSTFIGTNEAASTVQYVAAPLGLLIRGGPNYGLGIRSAENPFWGTFNNIFLLCRTIEEGFDEL